MAVYAKDFEYGGSNLLSKSTAYALVSFDDNGIGSSSILQRTVKRSDLTSDSYITHDYGATDADVMKFDVTICKACDSSGDKFTQDEVRTIIGWLTSQNDPKELYFTGMNGDEIYTDLHFFGRFVKAEYIDMGGGTDKFAIKAYFENISPYAFTKIYSYNIYSYSDSNGVLEIESQGTHTGKLIEPIITITPTSSGVVTIDNTSDSIPAFSVKVTSGVPITIENKNVFKNDWSLYDFSNCNNLYFPVITDGTNTFVVTGACQVTIKVRYLENIGI